MNALIAILAADSQGSALGGLLPLLILAPLIYMMIVPQRKAKKKQAEMLASLNVGDDVVTSGGIHGFITFLEDTVAHVQVDTDVVIRVNKSALTRISPPADDVDDEPAADLTDTREPAPAPAEGPTGAIVSDTDAPKAKSAKITKS